MSNFVELLLKWCRLWSLVGVLQDLSESAVFTNDESNVSSFSSSTTCSREDNWGWERVSFARVWRHGLLFSKMVLLIETIHTLSECFLLALVTLTCHSSLIGLELVAGENKAINWGLNTDLQLNDISGDNMVVVNVLDEFAVS